MLVLCEPPLFAHLSAVGHQQTNGVTLSRPKDFIAALTKERGSSCRSSESSQTSSASWENSSTLSRDQSPSQTRDNSNNSGCHLRRWPEDQNPSTSTLNLEVRDLNRTSSTGRGDSLNQNGEIYSDTEDTERGHR